MDRAQGCQVELFGLERNARGLVALSPFALLGEVPRKLDERVLSLLLVSCGNNEMKVTGPWLGNDEFVDKPAAYRKPKAAA